MAIRYRTAVFLAACLVVGLLFAWQDDRFWALGVNTFWLALGAIAISVPLGTALAILLVRTDLPGRSVLGRALALLLFVPAYLQAAAWQAGFGLQGWYTSMFSGGLWLSGWPGAVWVHGLAALPWTTLIVGLGLKFVPPELEEEALLDGGAGQVFRRVTLPLTGGAIAAAALWVAVTVAGDMTIAALFQAPTYPEQLYMEFALADEPGDAPLGILPGMLLTGWLALTALVCAKQFTESHRPASVGRACIFPLGWWRWPALGCVLAVLSLAVGIPFANLCFKAGVVVTRSMSGDLSRDWSIWKCVAVVGQSPWVYRLEILRSLELSLLAATTAVAIALPLCWFARRGGIRALPAASTAATLFAVPGPVIGLFLIWLLNRPEAPWLTRLYDDPIFAPWAALTARALPLPILVLLFAMRTVAGEPLEAAAVEGAGPLARLWRLAIPQRLPAIFAAWLAAFVVALGDVGATVLILPPGVEPLSHRIFGLIHSGQEDEVAGICLALALMLALAGWAWHAAWTRFEK